MKAATVAAKFIRAFQKIYVKKWIFLAAFFIVFLVTVGALAAFDLLPNAPPKLVSDAPAVTATSTASLGLTESPVRIEIPAISLKEPVSNPLSADVKALDTALLKGPVRYPSSSNLGEAGNVIIFGHSSYLPIVNNKEFKAFDGIQKLHANNAIKVYGSSRVYTYAVDTVTKADANADAIPLSVAGNRLTLATCDSFGKKSGRFIVTAHLVGSDPIGA